MWPLGMVFFEKIFWGDRRARKDKESGKQCKAVPTLRKLPISAFAETDSFMLVEAPPQSPQNTTFVFWNAGYILRLRDFANR